MDGGGGCVEGVWGGVLGLYLVCTVRGHGQ